METKRKHRNRCKHYFNVIPPTSDLPPWCGLRTLPYEEQFNKTYNDWKCTGVNCGFYIERDK